MASTLGSKHAVYTDEEICWMLESMTIQTGWQTKHDNDHLSLIPTDSTLNCSMDLEEASCDQLDQNEIQARESSTNYEQPSLPLSRDPSPDPESSANPGPAAHLAGCPMLQCVQQQIEDLQTTGGVYLDTIFAHREAFSAFPRGHATCSRAFGDLARALEQRAWSAGREADVEAVVVFRQEAWLLANYFIRGTF